MEASSLRIACFRLLLRSFSKTNVAGCTRSLSTSSPNPQSSSSSVVKASKVDVKTKKTAARFPAAAKKNPLMERRSEVQEKSVLSNELPLYFRSLGQSQRTAVCDADEDVQYSEAYKRSLLLAKAIENEIGRSDASRPIGFIASNTVADLVTLWAIWMTGNAAVSVQKEVSLSNAIRHSRCQLVILSKNSVQEVDRLFEESASPNFIVYDDVLSSPYEEVCLQATDLTSSEVVKTDLHYKQHQTALTLFTNSYSSPITFRHSDLNAQCDRIISAWGLHHFSSVLHTLPLAGNAFGMISAFLAPTAAGGRVVMLQNFDTIKVWSHLLGIGLNGSQPPPKVNLYPALPKHFSKLIDRYQQLFTESKTKEFVKSKCGQRLVATLSNISPRSDGSSVQLKRKWREATGHNLIECYTDDRLGTVLCGDIKTARDKWINHEGSQEMKPLKNVKVHLARRGDLKSGVPLQITSKEAELWLPIDKKGKRTKGGIVLS